MATTVGTPVVMLAVACLPSASYVGAAEWGMVVVLLVQMAALVHLAAGTAAPPFFVTQDGNLLDSSASLSGTQDGSSSLSGTQDGSSSLSGMQDGSSSLSGMLDSSSSLSDTKKRSSSLSGTQDGSSSPSGS
ncbi:UNVERIFIED_CONTAM: hypothetical protein FKN15_067360 [Acipenser sinensis]